MEHIFKLFEFNIYNDKGCDDEEEHFGNKIDSSKFVIQMFGLNEQGKRASIIVEDYLPFFYVKVDNNWGPTKKMEFYNHLKLKVGKYYENSIVECKIIKRKKLYGFDAGKDHRFIELKFANIPAYNKVKNLWYETSTNNESGESERTLIKPGYKFNNTFIELYEANIPPLLRFFHLRTISPSGWVALPILKTTQITGINKTTSCDYEFIVSYKNVLPLNHMETRVPYKIMSFDIEASSSHGDFPVPIKSYKKLATNIVDCFDKLEKDITKDLCKDMLRAIIKAAFGYSEKNNIDLVYPKIKLTNEKEVEDRTESWLKTKVRDCKSELNNEHLIESLFEKANKEFLKPDIVTKDKGDKWGDGEGGDEADDSSDDEDENLDSDTKKEKEIIDNAVTYYKIGSGFGKESYKNKESTIVDIMCDVKFEREGKINELIRSLRNNFPPLEGDKVTFIGSTFMTYGEPIPHLNHCIVLNSCDQMNVSNSQMETCETEQDVLLAWSALIQRENPDIIIGYNIFGFDYEFMFRRSQELDCVDEFLKLSRNNNEVCCSYDYKNPTAIDIDRSTTTLASGTYDLSIIKMNGRLQIDMLNWFRRTENFTSYKLDYVGGHIIGDDVKQLLHLNDDNNLQITRIKTTNMTGLQVDSYIHFEEINHSSDYYKDGSKFKISQVNTAEGWFEIFGHETPSGKKVKWGLAKDDVTPKDIFRMTNEGPASRAIIAKYCIQDCNLVHYLFNKIDVITDLVEMSTLCSVPMSFLIFRGQGIKLTSYVAKKCREKGVLMPVIDKGSMDDGYEGAIVLDPKCGLYLDDPVCVGDFASLYPSSMLSENLCPSSKVWTTIFDLAGNLILETGEKDKTGKYIYDNLPEYEYVDIKFDTYRYIRKTPKSKAEKVKSGYKMCRFAQPLIKDGQEEKAIMPAILQELLKARKDTRKLIPQMPDEFMKNVLEKRQLAYKVTANSLYGQLGAKTSTFYEPDIAASTTATGRLLLTYAKRVAEECYADTNIETKYGIVNTKSEYVYGDTDSVFFKFNLTDKETGEKIIGEKALELSIEIAQEACKTVSKFLKQPHDFEYEKTFMPFCLLSKKRYVAIKYDFDIKNGKRNEMGIVLKRRDNAPIVKDIYGGVIDILMKEKNIQKAIEYVNSSLQELITGTVPIEKLIITKSLRSFYKNPQGVAHKVLADRISAREPGNKPASGDRIPFVYIITKASAKGQKILQGNRIENPNYIKENHLPIDYSFYITNQIMKPLLQLFGLVLNDIWKMQNKTTKILKFQKEIEKVRIEIEDNKKYDEKVSKLKNKEVQILLFDKYLRDTNNAKDGNQSISKLFGSKK
jgi:DNA polymerase elongation subunit (family B)